MGPKKCPSRCPKGSRCDTKIGECVAPNVNVPPPSTTKKKKCPQRCPKKTRCNRKKGVCETIDGAAAAVAATTPPPLPLPPHEELIIPPSLTETTTAAAAAAAVPSSHTIEKTITEKPKLTSISSSSSTEEEINNTVLFNKEIREYKENEKDTQYHFMYPELNDGRFIDKLSIKKEFYDLRYEGTIYDIKSTAEELCNRKFELSPHQQFVRNFLSMQTPYNSLLLYHGLGTGKTCSAISIAEEMRDYMKQTGVINPIFIVASPNVQANFYKELFDESRLIKINDNWTMKSCLGAKLIQEVNPTNLPIPRAKMSSQIRSIINKYYSFKGYIEFGRYIERKTIFEFDNPEEKERVKIFNIKKTFSNRLIIIDEVHNIRTVGNNDEGKKIGTMLTEIARYAENVRFVFLSATPLFNSHKEIIWLTNLMNLNDGRALIDESQVFQRDDVVDAVTAAETTSTDIFVNRTRENTESGRELLSRKLNGYVSYVRGENPYTFPYRLYPRDFADPAHQFGAGKQSPKYPVIQANGQIIEQPLQYVPVYLQEMKSTQLRGYKKAIEKFQIDKLTENEDDTEVNEDESDSDSSEVNTPEHTRRFGYNMLQTPLQTLNIVYPSMHRHSPIEKQIGNQGLHRIMKSKGMLNEQQRETYRLGNTSYTERFNFEYRELDEDGMKVPEIFSPQNIGKYSHKIATICDKIRNSNGIVIVYSFFIDGGLIPMALALESIGFQRHGSTSQTKSLFKTPPTEPVDSITMQPRSQMTDPTKFRPAKYVMITGNKMYSKDNSRDLKEITEIKNADGNNIKVVLISRSGSEGLDFKNIRQIHIMDAWYNMNRVEQIIGRGVRHLSHCALDFVDRNVEIYLHASMIKTTEEEDEEALDLYLYRRAEQKSRQIGIVTRMMKEVSVDCLLNIEQTNYTAQNMRKQLEAQKLQPVIQQRLSSSNRIIEYTVGDRSYSDICDYMEDCRHQCQCKLTTQKLLKMNPDTSTYTVEFMRSNHRAIVERIRQLFREQPVYRRDLLIKLINIPKSYPREQIFNVLTEFIENDTMLLYDDVNREGYMLNRGDYYLFQPAEITDENLTILERTIPPDVKHDEIQLEIAPLPPSRQRTRRRAVDVAAPTAAPKQDDDDVPIDIQLQRQRPDFLDTFKENMRIFDKSNLQKKVPKKEKMNWYYRAKRIVEHVYTQYGIDESQLRRFVIHHMVDTTPNRLLLLQYYENLPTTFAAATAAAAVAATSIDEIIQEYLTTQKVVVELESKIYSGYFIDNDFYLTDGFVRQKWERLDQSILPQVQHELIQQFTRQRKFHNYVGFIEHVKNESVFKLKDRTLKFKNKGSVCGGVMGKKDLVLRLAAIQNEAFRDDSHYQPVNYGNITEFEQADLCCLMEILLRYFEDVQMAAPIDTVMTWFITADLVDFSNLHITTRGK